MTDTTFLDLLRKQGVEIAVANGKLRLSALPGLLTEEIQAEVRRRKPQLLELLSAQQSPLHESRTNDIATFSLSRAQERIWLAESFTPGTPAYTVWDASVVDAPVELEMLQQAFDQLVARHGALRSWITGDQAKPTLSISALLTAQVTFTDLTSMERSFGRAELTRLIQDDIQRPFNLKVPPLIRCRLIRKERSEHIVLLSMHHIVADGQSLKIIQRELAALYEAAADRREAILPKLTMQYAEYTASERELLAAKRELQLAYWRKQLADAPPRLELPFSRPRLPVPSFRGATERIEIPEGLAISLRELAQSEKSSLYMLLLAAYSVLLLRYTGQRDVCIGTPVSRRSQPGTENMIGLFVDTVVMRCKPEPSGSFRELMRQVRSTALDGFSHSDLPFQSIVQELCPIREPNISPLFQTMFSLMVSSSELSNRPQGRGLLELISEESLMQVAKFDLTLQLEDSGRSIPGSFEYSTDLFSAEAIQSFAASFGVLLRSIVKAPDLPLADLPILSEEERSRILKDWNQTVLEYPHRALIHSLFEAQVARTPHAIAVIQNEISVTYAVLNAQANQIAHTLLELGLKAEECVGVCMRRSVSMIAALLAILKAGGAYVPLDPEYPANRLEAMLSSSRARIVVAEEGTKQHLSQKGREMLLLDAKALASAGLPSSNPEIEMSSDRLAYVIYTSGSTGQPKGVAIQHNSAVSFVHWAKATHTEQELSRVLAVTSICFDLSIFEIFVPLCWSYTIVLAESALHLMRVAEAGAVTLVNTVPSAVGALLGAGRLPQTVLRVNLAGEPVPASLVQTIEARSPGVQVFDLYGPTEATVYSTCARRYGDQLPTIGRPVGNTQIYILDERLQPVPVGAPGEIFIGGVQVARGYLYQPEITTERFVTVATLPDAGRLYRTGDLAKFRSNGDIEYLGRIDQQVKINGFRIELGEIESVLRRHPSVSDVVVVVQRLAGIGNALTAFVIADSDTLQAEELIAFQRQHLPGYMVAQRFEMLKKLPLTPNGKIDRRALVESKIENDNVGLRVQDEPANKIEEGLSDIWKSCFERTDVSVNDDFFALGGNSLLALRMFSEIERTLCVTLLISVLFQAPTIRLLAKEISKTQH